MRRTFLSLMGALTLAAATVAPAQDRVLIVVTNHDKLGETGRQTGYYLSEVSHPWQVITEAGYVVDFASPRGGAAPMDPTSMDLSDPINASFWGSETNRRALENTISLAAVDAARYRAIIFAGGHGTMWDFPTDAALARVTRTIYESGGVVAAVCHGPAALVGVTLSDGTPLVAGRRVACFTNAEEEAVGLTAVMPFLLETRLTELGAKPETAENFSAKVVVDGRLVTGQNPASATGLGREVVKLLQTTKTAAKEAAPVSTSPLLSTPFETASGSTTTLGATPAKAYLIVNTASRCGYTGQYADLERLHQDYKDRGLVVMAFPSNDFGNQEPGTNEEIQEFCRTRYAVTFPVQGKMTVKGDAKSPLYQLLTGEGSPTPGEVKWNFEKFVVDGQGNVVARFPSRTKPSDPALIAAVEKALNREG